MHQEKWSSLTENLYTTLQEITNERESTFTPSALLDSLRKKCKMFIGYSQHDSHELLRHLMDSVRDDDLKVNITTNIISTPKVEQNTGSRRCTFIHAVLE